MAIRSRKNEYKGVNAHLNSYLQGEDGGWESFHAAHIEILRWAIDALLPTGYYVFSEKSLQLSELNVMTGETSVHQTKPDVSIYERGGASAGSRPGQYADTPIATFPLMETLSEEETLHSAVIYRVTEEQGSVPVTRVELLSPANKPRGSHYTHYLVKRGETLRSGINLVEVDYLHETHPIITKVSSYAGSEEGAYPYTIVVSNPHPTLDEGETAVYGAHVDAPLPKVPIPLAGDDKITLDLGPVYDETFYRNRFYGEVAVDYAQEPARMERYSAADQERIRARMEAVRREVGS